MKALVHHHAKWRLWLSCFVIAWTVCSVVFYELLHVANHDGAAVPPDLVLVVNHHKTGTAMTGCMLGTFVETLNAAGLMHRYTYTDSAPDVHVHPHMLFLKVRETQDIHSAALQKMRSNSSTPAGSAVGGGSSLEAEERQREALATSPSLIYHMGSRLPLVCYDNDKIAAAGRARLNPNDTSAKPLVDPRGTCREVQCPCNGWHMNCFSLGACFSPLPQINYRVIHVIRDPLEIILSAYNYHVKLPRAEAWLKTTKLRQTAMWWQDMGANITLLNELQLLDLKHDRLNTTYGHFLAAAPQRAGILTEALNSLFEVWAMARNYVNWVRVTDRVLVLRYEELNEHHDALVNKLLDFTAIPHSARVRTTALARMRRCDLHTWSEDELRSSDHVTHVTSADNRASLVGHLISNDYIWGNICSLQSILGYPQHAACPVMQPASPPGGSPGAAGGQGGAAVQGVTPATASA